jgi:hypothetical protein
MATYVPDGIVCFFTSYKYMEDVVSMWEEQGTIRQVTSSSSSIIIIIIIIIMVVVGLVLVMVVISVYTWRMSSLCGRSKALSGRLLVVVVVLVGLVVKLISIRK